MNETLQYVIIAAILAGCIYFTVKSFRHRARRGGGCQCDGCSIKDACKSPTKGNPNGGTSNGDCSRQQTTAK